MRLKTLLYCSLLLFFCQTLNGCIWAGRCPEKTCKVSREHKHENGVYRSRAAFSWVTSKKHWPWSRLVGRHKFNGKKDKKTGKTKFKYTLPGEKQ